MILHWIQLICLMLFITTGTWIAAAGIFLLAVILALMVGPIAFFVSAIAAPVIVVYICVNLNTKRRGAFDRHVVQEINQEEAPGSEDLHPDHPPSVSNPYQEHLSGAHGMNENDMPATQEPKQIPPVQKPNQEDLTDAPKSNEDDLPSIEESNKKFSVSTEPNEDDIRAIEEPKQDLTSTQGPNKDYPPTVAEPNRDLPGVPESNVDDFLAKQQPKRDDLLSSQEQNKDDLSATQGPKRHDLPASNVRTYMNRRKLHKKSNVTE